MITAALMLGMLAPEERWCGLLQSEAYADRVEIARTEYDGVPSRLHLVADVFQTAAQARLASGSTLVLSRAEARAMLRPGDRLVSEDRLLLVRAGAIPATNEGAIFIASYSKSGEQLFIESAALAPSTAVAGNIALMIELEDPVVLVSVSCVADE